jgi:hypothetical protein
MDRIKKATAALNVMRRSFQDIYDEKGEEKANSDEKDLLASLSALLFFH